MPQVMGQVQGPAGLQTSKEQRALLKALKKAASRIPASHQQFLSSHARNIIHLAETWSVERPVGVPIKPDQGRALNQVAGNGPNASTLPRELAAATTGPVMVSDPTSDYKLSVTAGFTQSETSSAWCGNSILVGYNDSGSFLQSMQAGTGLSLNGYSVSLNGGRNFIDMGYLGHETRNTDFLLGDPVVGCVSPVRFFYASLFETRDSNNAPLTAISVSLSRRLNFSLWSFPFVAVAKDATTHFLDKDWMVVDPNNPIDMFTPRNIYVTYTDFDSSKTSATCPNQFRQAIEMVRSSDGGFTWSAPTVVVEDCGGPGVQGSSIAVGPNGHVYVAYLMGGGAIFVRTFNPDGTPASPAVLAANATPTGSAGLLQGGFRSNEFPSLAVDRASGTIYMAFAGGDNLFADLNSGTYNYGDIFVTSSSDGVNWSTAVPISPMDPAFTGRGRDQFMPGVAVDSTGAVAVCYYDRRNDPINNNIDRYCSVSRDHGGTWVDQRITLASWTPTHFSDAIINPEYMGDYDSLTTDYLQTNTGFFGAFQIQSSGNPDVWGQRF
jgi:hypothetical protein